MRGLQTAPPCPSPGTSISSSTKDSASSRSISGVGALDRLGELGSHNASGWVSSLTVYLRSRSFYSFFFTDSLHVGFSAIPPARFIPCRALNARSFHHSPGPPRAWFKDTEGNIGPLTSTMYSYFARAS